MKNALNSGSVMGAVLFLLAAILVERLSPCLVGAVVASASLAATLSISFMSSIASFLVRPFIFTNRSPGMIVSSFVFMFLQQNEFVATFDVTMWPSKVIL